MKHVVSNALTGEPRGTDERMPGAILLVAGLLADQNDLRRGWPFTKDGLRRALPQIAGAARTRGASSLLERRRSILDRFAPGLGIVHVAVVEGDVEVARGTAIVVDPPATCIASIRASAVPMHESLSTSRRDTLQLFPAPLYTASV